MFLGLLGMLALLLGVVGLIRRRVPFTPLKGRKPAAGLLAAGLFLTWLGGTLLPQPVQAEQLQQAQETSVTPPSQPVVEQEPQPEEPQGERISIGDFLVECREAVKEQLKSPSTAKFPGLLESDAQARETDDGQRVWVGWVDAENGFGGTVRTDFICTYDPQTEEFVANLQ
jgi:hypothetical protein